MTLFQQQQQQQQEAEDVFNCLQHTSKRRPSNGVCPHCLKERLSALCPDCANLRPCSCSSSSDTNSTTSSTFSLSFNHRDSDFSFGPISNLIDDEPPFFPARSAFPFFRSARFSDATVAPPMEQDRKSSSFWSVLFRRNYNKDKSNLTRSKSVAATGRDDLKSSLPQVKGKRWYFASPMKAFWHSKASKVAHQRSPLHRS